MLMNPHFISIDDLNVDETFQLTKRLQYKKLEIKELIT